MDISQWLEHTADRAPPDPPEDLQLHDIVHPLVEPGQSTRKYRRKRKRASSDSSIIAPRPPKRRHPSGVGRAHSSDHVRTTEHAEARSRSSQTSQSASFVHEQGPTKRYEKRARHKTRPDRYEPKSRKHGRDDAVHHERTSKPKRRQSHRSGDGGRTTGLVQSFQLQSGSKNSRLTVSMTCVCHRVVVNLTDSIVLAQAASKCGSFQTWQSISASGRAERWM